VKILVVANPVAGGGRARPAADALAARLASRGADTELHVTTGPGDAAAAAAAHEGRVDRFVVAGGDGTLNEVLNGLATPWRTPLALLAQGTANLLARELGLPTDPEGIADVVLGGRVRRLDLATVRETPPDSGAPARARRFLLVASCGFDAQVVEVLARTRRGTLGFAGWLAPILRALATYRPPVLAVTVDAAQPFAAELVVVSNVRNYGGLFTVAERARPDSGHLDVVALERASRRNLVRAAVAARRGRLSRLPGVRYETGRSVAIRCAQPVPVEVDGEEFGATPVAIDLEPRVVPVLVPRA
jgi:YegS/Rv2252/BmrU family lipid kinase